MSNILFANNAATRLSADVTPNVTNIPVVEGSTNVFPLFTTGSEYFMLCLANGDGTYEIVKCIGKNSNSFTVVRAQEGTKAIYFPQGSLVEHRLTAGSLTQILNDTIASSTDPGRMRIATDEEARLGKTTGGTPAAISPEQLKRHSVLAGTIVTFSGSFSGKNPIPRGQTTPDTTWQICDGTNNTPDLRDRFIVGAGASYAADSTGGNTSHGHTEAAHTTLTASQMPSHSHATGNTIAFDYNNGKDFYYMYSSGRFRTDTTASGGSQSHTHSIPGTPNNNIPPYYALTYIIKL